MNKKNVLIVLSVLSIIFSIVTTYAVRKSNVHYAIGCVITAFAVLAFIMLLFPEKCWGKERVSLNPNVIQRSVYIGHATHYQQLMREHNFITRVGYITKHNNPKFYRKHKNFIETRASIIRSHARRELNKIHEQEQYYV